MPAPVDATPAGAAVALFTAAHVATLHRAEAAEVLGAQHGQQRQGDAVMRLALTPYMHKRMWRRALTGALLHNELTCNH